MDAQTSLGGVDLTAVFAALPGATAVSAADPSRFTVLLASDSFLSLARRPRDAVVGQPLAEVFPDASPEAPRAGRLPGLLASVEAAVRTGVTQRMEQQRHDLTRPDGTWEARYWDVVNVPVPGPDGAVRHVLHQLTDVTARVQDEAVAARTALRASEEKYRALFNEMDEAYAVVEVMADASGRWTDFLFLEVNPAFMRHTGMPYPVGRTATQLLGTPNPRWAELYGRAAATGESIRLEESEFMLGRLFDLNIFRLGGEGSRQVAVLFTDITERRRAGDAVRESERRFRLLFENMGEGFALAEMIWDADGRPADWRYLEVNDAWAQTGVPVSQTLGRTAREVNPEIEPDWIETYGRVVQTGQPVTYERYAKGFGKWFDTVAFKHSENRFGLIFRDVTGRKQAEAERRASAERQAFLFKLGDALRPLSSATEITQAAARVLGEHLGVNRAFYAEVEGDDWRVEDAYEHGIEPQARGRHPLARFGQWIVDTLRAGEHLVIRDLDTDARFTPAQRAAHDAYQILGAAAVPLVKEGTLVAILVVHTVTPRDWSAHELALVEETAERTWAAVGRARTEAALRASEARYRTLFQSMDEGFVIADVLYDAEGRPEDVLYLEGNPAASRLTGIPDFLGRRLRDALPGVEPYWLELYDRVARTGVAVRMERCLEEPHGRWYDFHISRTAAGAPDGSGDGSRRVAVVFQEITARKRAEQSVRENEERLRRALSIPTVGVLFFRLDGTLVDANAALEQMMGYTPEELRGLEDWSVLTPPEFMEVTERAAVELAERGGSAPFEKQWIRKDGSRMWGLFAPTRLSGSGRESECVEFIIDITRAKEAEAALRESEGRFRMVADNIAQLSWTCDTLGNVTWYNQRWLDYTGLPFEDMKGRNWSKVLHPDHLKRVLTGVKHSAETGEPWADTFPLRGKNGRYRWFLSRAVPIRDERGDIVRWFGTNTDVTDLREANHAKDEFLAMLGHELRNPLAPIVSTLELMRMDGGRKFSKEREMMVRQARHLAALLDDLMDVSRLARGKVEIARKTVALDELVDRAVEAAGPLIEQRRHLLSVDVAPGLWVSADETRMVQVISNLLTNAAHYTPPGGHVWVTGQRDGRSVVLRVRDDGVGISEEILPRVFERFQQGLRTQDRPQGGLGLGLAIVHSLVQLHGGTVTAESEGLGKGSEFAVRLPKARAPRAPTPRARPKAAKKAAPAPEHRLLVVDDNRAIADALTLLLTKSGHTVDTAYDGLTALEVATRFQPTIAILDIGLPDMSGYELARRLRKQKGFSKGKLVALTGYGAKEDRLRAKQAGFAEHLAKPIELNDLLATLDRISTPSTPKGARRR